SDEITEEEIAQRRDFREVTTFTIDPIDAKDFDDALSVRYLDDGHLEIGVHIADVSHYVKPDSQLDKEAYHRSTSVYLVDRVCPMLPERLSNELCSLRPNEDKLTFSAVFEFDKDFKVRRRWFGRAIIHSDRRFHYEEAQQILDQGKGDFYTELKQLNDIAKVLRKRRFRRGSIDFASEEVRFRLAEDGTPLEVYVKPSFETNKLIEEFMLLANREVATYISRKESARHERLPFVYRVHDDPDPEKAEELARFARALGFEMDVSSGEAIAKSYNRLIRAAEKDPTLKMLAPLAIRTMAKAIYTTENIGHYGLGFAHYTHFTSPIRRYSDVLVHRILDKNLGKGQVHKANIRQLDEQCKHISAQEKKAAEAERESVKYKQVEFIEKHIGEVFPGKVNGLADFGVFVELNDSRCEGMIAFDRMDQPYEMGEGRLSIRGRRNGQLIRMGDEIKVRVIDTDIKRRRIEMEFVALSAKASENGRETAPRQNNGAPSPRRGRSGKGHRNARKK
ncbi:MAG: VacB/RNase II family 3'-5' exoribonuclease, partial [Lewinella sp.]|nr:VacB/RNase II family 3'-5' exoribonuclease [Lewinella sp.]